MKPISSKALFHAPCSSLFQCRIFISLFSTSSIPASRRHEEESRSVRVSVWWDFENCNVPADVNVFKVAHTITAAIRANGMKGPITITAFGDVLQLSRGTQEALSSTGINMAHVPRGGKNSADRLLLLDLMYWVSQNPPPAHLFLISGDRDFASTLHRLRMNNYNILLASPDTAPGVLCSAASIMWHWNSLVRGESLMGKYFNHPPDGPYGSWYGHYKVPLEDPFSTTEQRASSYIEEASDLASDSKLRPIPKAVVRQIRQILNSYPSGISITELRSELNKSSVSIDKDLYGYKKFSRFLLSMPHILKLQPGSDGQFFVHGITRKAPEPFESSPDTYSGHICRNSDQDISKPTKSNGEESYKDGAVDSKSILPLSSEVKVKEPSGKNQQTPELSEKVVSMEAQEHMKVMKHTPPTDKKVAEPVSIQDFVRNLPPVVEQDSASEVGFFRKIWLRFFGGNNVVSEIKSENISKKCGDLGDISEKISQNNPEKSCAHSDKLETTKVDEKCMRSPSQDSSPVGSAEENKSARSAEACGDKSTTSPGVLNRMINRFKFWSSIQGNDKLGDLSNERRSEVNSNSQKHEIFSKDSFWSDMESFINSPRGSAIFSQSRFREQMAQFLKKEGPLALRDLSDSDLLNLVNLLISEKKWVEECSSEMPPFKLTRPVANRSSLDNSGGANGLRSIFLATQSQSNPLNAPELDRGKKVQNISHAGVSAPSNSTEKPSDRSRNDILADCQKLVDEILKQYPVGYNMGSFRKLFLERYGYHLDLQKLGYVKLASLLQIMKGVNIESSYIYPSSKVVGDSDLETLVSNAQEDNAHQPSANSDSELSGTSKKNDDSDSPWEELGPVSNSSVDRKELQSMLKTRKIKEGIKQTYPDYEPAVSDDEISDSEGESSAETLPEGQRKPGINEEDSSLLQILDSWFSNKEDDNRKENSVNVDGMADCSTNGVQPSVSSELASRSEAYSRIFGQKQRTQRNYSFVSDSIDNNKDKLVDGILRSLKKPGESRCKAEGHE